MDEVGLGKSLQRARQAAGITQQELCQRANLSYSTLAKIERGAIKSPSIFTIQRISQALNIDLNQLIGGTSSPDAPKKKLSKTGVGFVYFDINGCLVRSYQRGFTRLAADHNLPVETVETAFWHFNDAICRGEINFDEFNTKFAEKLNVSGLDWKEYYLSSVEPVTEMHELVHWAKDRYKIGLLSNIMPGIIDALKERQLIPNIEYAAIIDSSQVGSVKPEAKIYEVAQERAGVPPQEILFVDDSRTNLMAAARLGWHVLWLDGYDPGDNMPKIWSALELPTDEQPPENHEPNQW